MNRHHGLSQFTSSSDVYIPATLALEKAIDHVPVVPLLVGGLHEQPARGDDARLSSTPAASMEQQHIDTPTLFFPTIRWSDSGADLSSSSCCNHSPKKRRGGVTTTMNDISNRCNKVARKTTASLSCKKTKQLRRAKKHLLRCMSVKSRLNLMSLDTSLHYENKQNSNNNEHTKKLLQDLFLAPIFLLPTTIKEESAATTTNDDVNDWSYNVVGWNCFQGVRASVWVCVCVCVCARGWTSLYIYTCFPVSITSTHTCTHNYYSNTICSNEMVLMRTPTTAYIVIAIHVNRNRRLNASNVDWLWGDTTRPGPKLLYILFLLFWIPIVCLWLGG